MLVSFSKSLIRGCTSRGSSLVLAKRNHPTKIAVNLGSSSISSNYSSCSPFLLFSSTTYSSSRKTDATETANVAQPNQHEAAVAAVIRYDNNCATIPYVGTYEEALSLKERMEANTHKHHIFLVEGNFPHEVPLGPYPSLDEAKKSLRYHCQDDEK